MRSLTSGKYYGNYQDTAVFAAWALRILCSQDSAGKKRGHPQGKLTVIAGGGRAALRNGRQPHSNCE